MGRKKALVTYISNSTFIEKDVEFLKEISSVELYHFGRSKGILNTIWRLVKQFFLLFFRLRSYDLHFIWFADYHAFLPVIFSKITRKKSFVVVGGFDVTNIPSIDYGIGNANSFRRLLNKFVLSNASYILPVHKSLITGENSYDILNSPKQLPVGVYKVIGHSRNNVIAIPTGYNHNYWFNNFEGTKSGIMCVAGINSKNSWELKGGDLMALLAKELPEAEFHFYGISDSIRQHLQKPDFPSNFHLHPYIKNEDLQNIYSKHKIYLQLSLSEGLPNSLCEAMLCECIPVGSNVNGIADAIGETGYVLEHKDLKKALGLVKKALKDGPQKGKEARERIITKFPEEKRWQRLNEII